MSENTNIEWATHTFNPWEGCQKISPGCDNCYAENRNARFSGGVAVNWGPGAPRRLTSPANWRKPLAWDKAHVEFFAQHGHRQRVFCASLADVFDNAVDPQWRAELFELIAQTPNLDWLLLTKRIGNVNSMLPPDRRGSPHSWGCGWANVWIGATIVNQEEAERDIPKLLAVPAAKRFLSMEPLLGPVDISKWVDPDLFTGCADDGFPTIDWVIAGGESGPNARPMHPDWVRDLRDQCASFSIPFLFKQWGEWRSICQGGDDWYQSLYRSRKKAGVDESQAAFDDMWGRDCTVPDLCLRSDGQHAGITEPGAWQQGTGSVQAFKVGKKSAGRLLDGVTHDGYPAE